MVFYFYEWTLGFYFIIKCINLFIYFIKMPSLHIFRRFDTFKLIGCCFRILNMWNIMWNIWNMWKMRIWTSDSFLYPPPTGPLPPNHASLPSVTSPSAEWSCGLYSCCPSIYSGNITAVYRQCSVPHCKSYMMSSINGTTKLLKTST